MLTLVLITVVIVGIATSGMTYADALSIENKHAEATMTAIMNVLYNATIEPRDHEKCARDHTHWLFIATGVFAVLISQLLRFIIDIVAYVKLYKKDRKVI